MPLPPEDDHAGNALRLAPRCTTEMAVDLRSDLVLASEAGGDLLIDGSAVESVGQAVLQLLIATEREASGLGRRLVIIDPSPALEAVLSSGGLAQSLGLICQKAEIQ